MVACSEAAKICDSFIDGEASMGERLRILVHICECDNCAGLFRQKSTLKQLIRASARKLTAPPALRFAVRAQLGA